MLWGAVELRGSVVAATAVDGVVGGAFAEQVDRRIDLKSLLGMNLRGTRSTAPAERLDHHLKAVRDQLCLQPISWAVSRWIHQPPRLATMARGGAAATAGLVVAVV